MASFSTPGARPPASPILPAAAQGAGRTASVPVAPASGKLAAPLPTVNPVRLLDDVVSLSSQGIQAKGSELIASTSDSAQSFVSKIAQNMFGDLSETASVAYNLASLKSASGLGTTSAADGTVRSATLDPAENASFIGTGQIATQDGRTLDFEVAVKYQVKTEEGAPAPRQVVEMPDVLVLTGKPLPAIEFPGSLNDLFKLLSRELRTEVSSNGSAGTNSGNMTLRLMRLVDTAALLAPRLRPDDPEATPADRAKAAVASTYGSAPAIGASPTPS